MASPMAGMDPQMLMMLIQQLKQKGIDPSMLGGGAAAITPLGGPGQPPALPPLPPVGNLPGMPGPGAPGGASPFGPPPSGAPVAPQAPPAPSAGAPGVTPPARPAGGSGDPQMNSVNMVLGQSAFGPEERNLDRQMKMADELRGTRMPGMRSAGNVTRAAHPLEFASAAFDRVGGQIMGDRTMEAQQKMFEKRMQKLRDDMAAGKQGAEDSGAGYGTREMGPGWGTGEL